MIHETNAPRSITEQLIAQSRAGEAGANLTDWALKEMPGKLLGFDIVIDPTLPDGMAEIKDGDKLLCRIVGIAPNLNSPTQENP